MDFNKTHCSAVLINWTLTCNVIFFLTFLSWEDHWVSGVFGSQVGMSEQQLFRNSSSILSLPCIEIFTPFQERTFL